LILIIRIIAGFIILDMVVIGFAILIKYRLGKRGKQSDKSKESASSPKAEATPLLQKPPE
ncbi:hypothetical protein TELCIR_16735, partial [Teladorsagia circumcincta]